MTADVTLPRLRLNGTDLSADVAQVVTSAELDRTVAGASTLTVGLTDPSRKLLRSELFSQRTTATVDDVLLELVQVKKTADRLSVTFEDAAVADLRRSKGARSVAPGTATRVDFARLLVAEVPWIVFRGFDKAEPVKVQLARGSDTDPDEDTWACLRRLADEVEWRVMADRGVVYFGPDAWLRTLHGPAVVLRENTGPVDWIDFDIDAGKQVDTASVNVRMQRWALPPGASVQLEQSMGLARGAWMVGDVRRSVFSDLGTVELLRPHAGLPEPLPEPPPADFDDTAPEASGDGPAAPTTTRASSQGYVWPVQGRITSPFGPRSGRLHAGLDIAAPSGTPLVAARAGTVSFAGEAGGYGLVVYLDHDGAQTRYAHQSKILCRRGQTVAAGDRIGLVGSTGRSTGPHVHFEIRVGGQPRDPRLLLP